MRFLGDTTRDQLNLEWLRSEWWKIYGETDRAIIDEPDLADSVQTLRRAELLAYRSPILDAIPSGARYRSVLIEESDLSQLYLLTVWDWFLDTGRTFQLTATRQHLQPGRGGNISNARQEVTHFAAAQEKLPYLAGYDSEQSSELLVLVANDSAGPFTIIDGTHRATALLQLHDRTPNMPWRAVLIESPNMTMYRWHIDSTYTPTVISGLAALTDEGELW